MLVPYRVCIRGDECDGSGMVSSGAERGDWKPRETYLCMAACARLWDVVSMLYSRVNMRVGLDLILTAIYCTVVYLHEARASCDELLSSVLLHFARFVLNGNKMWCTNGPKVRRGGRTGWRA